MASVAGISHKLIVKLGRNKQYRSAAAVVVAAVIGGVYMLQVSQAATLAVAGETETGLVAGNSSVVSDTAASAQKSVRFGNAPSTGGGSGLNLPLIPWEGGPAYWDQFAVTKAAGWSDPNFFPFAIWFNGMSSNAEAQYDKSYGINSYAGMDTGTPYSLFADNNQFWIGGKLNSTFPANGKNWAGDFLDDEVDGRYSAAEGLALIKSLSDGYGNDGRFRYANYTQIVTGDYGATNNTNSEKYVNAFEGPVSVDHYFYTIPNCLTSLNYLAVPRDSAHCRTASSYGKAMKALRLRDAADGKLKPMWNFIENLNGGPGEGPYYAYISPGQLEGAVMSSIINEARGIFYFNQSFTGSCTTGGALRANQYNANYCAKPQMDAMKEVNLRVLALAPVVNSQSYQYTFGTNLDTMLKWYQGSGYIFAMLSGDAGSAPGSRSFSLPPELAKASSVQVVNENRTIPVSNGNFSDSFAAEYSYHIYKVTP